MDHPAQPLDGPVRPLSRPRAVIFDWDNTLIDSWAAIHDAQNHTFAAFGMEPWSYEEICRRVRGSMRDTFPQLFGERWREAGDIFYRRFEEKHLDALQPLLGAAELLAELTESGVYLAVVSNKRGDYLRAEVARLGWDQWFGRIVGAFDAARDKPAVEPVTMALEGSGIPAGDRVWLVGDADIDLECAVASGCVPVLVRPLAPADGEFVTHPPMLYAGDCMTLSKILRSM
jgi:phosphoglycolate phosphatase